MLNDSPEPTAEIHGRAISLWENRQFAQAIAEIELLLRREPRNPQFWDLKASILADAGNLDGAIVLYRDLLQNVPQLPFTWVRYANALRIAGQTEKSIAAYRKAISLKPGLGEAYCSLANLKTFRFAPAEIGSMQAQLRLSTLTRESRVAFHFALGKAFGDEGDYVQSFQQYSAGNAMWRAGLNYDPAIASEMVAQSRALFTQPFFAERAGAGFESAAPIFIVGMPRAGSTLIEQILASHSAVEGVGELPDIMAMAVRLDDAGGARYPAALAGLSSADLHELGAEYLECAKAQTKLGRPHFIDKMPNNFAHIGFIHLILPNAKIIDARRGAMACCFSNFTHHFARGQHYTYDLGELGRFYADYAALMAHYDTVLPGRVHRVSYESLVENPEAEIGGLLEYVGLVFEPDCLRFFESSRPVRTASSEQVRQPLFRESLEHWRHYEPWLSPLKQSLGQLAES